MIVKYSCLNGTGLQVVKQEAGWRAELNTLKKILPFYTLSSDACRYLAHIYSGLHELCVCHAQTFGAKQALITHWHWFPHENEEGNSNSIQGGLKQSGVLISVISPSTAYCIVSMWEITFNWVVTASIHLFASLSLCPQEIISPPSACHFIHSMGFR